MAYLMSSCPPIRCFLRKEFLFNLEKEHGNFVECTWIGIHSVQNKAIGFRIITNEGVQFNNLPINAFTTNKECTQLPLDICELWDCFSYNFSVHQFRWLNNKTCKVLLKDKTLHEAKYLFTISWCQSDVEGVFGYGEDSDVKDAHILLLESGQFVAQPNNRIIWNDLDFISNPLDLSKNPGYKILNQSFVCENSPKWRTLDNDDYFYEIKKEK